MNFEAQKKFSESDSEQVESEEVTMQELENPDFLSEEEGLGNEDSNLTEIIEAVRERIASTQVMEAVSERNFENAHFSEKYGNLVPGNDNKENVFNGENDAENTFFIEDISSEDSQIEEHPF